MSLPPNSVLVIDRGYIDFKLLNQWSQENIFFVAMIKDSIKYTAVEEKPLPEGKWENILKDEIIELSGLETKQSYPEKLRRVVVYDEKQKRTIELLTNNFNWTAETISELYRQRWQIEIFFKQLKNHLKIKSFIGTNENAIWIQIWTALITLLILKFLKEIAKYP
jgi:IS4 transposase